MPGGRADAEIELQRLAAGVGDFAERQLGRLDLGDGGTGEGRGGEKAENGG